MRTSRSYCRHKIKTKSLNKALCQAREVSEEKHGRVTYKKSSDGRRSGRLSKQEIGLK
jgi:hypothetical protein